MPKPPGFSHHAKAAKAAHDAGDHRTAHHHIGKMFGINRRAEKGGTAPADVPGPMPVSPPAAPRSKHSSVFARLRGHQ